jgi:hypothetical protein
MLLVAVGVVGIVALQVALTHGRSNQQALPATVSVFRVLQGADAVALIYSLATIFTGTMVLTINSTKLSIAYFLLGLCVRRKSFYNAAIRNVRYVRWLEETRTRSVERSGIRFQVGLKDHTFGTSITAPQALDLIDHMRMIYAFPIVEERQG